MIKYQKMGNTLLAEYVKAYDKFGKHAECCRKNGIDLSKPTDKQRLDYDYRALMDTHTRMITIKDMIKLCGFILIDEYGIEPKIAEVI